MSGLVRDPARVIALDDGSAAVEVGRRVEPVVERTQISRPTLIRVMRSYRERDPLVMDMEPSLLASAVKWAAILTVSWVLLRGCL